MIKPDLLVPTNKTGIIIMIFFCNTIRYMIFQYGREPVLIHRILFGFEATILKNIRSRMSPLTSSNKNQQMQRTCVE